MIFTIKKFRFSIIIFPFRDMGPGKLVVLHANRDKNKVNNHLLRRWL